MPQKAFNSERIVKSEQPVVKENPPTVKTIHKFGLGQKNVCDIFGTYPSTTDSTCINLLDKFNECGFE